MIQQQDQTDPIKFEVHMYHPTAMANAVTPTSWFYTLYVHTPSSIVQRDNPSRLEIAILLDSGASISVLNYPTYITLTKLLDIRSNHTSDVGPTRNSKTLTVANQTEVPILHYANIILNTTIDENSRYFSVPFAVADIKYNILGTPFFEDNIQNINIQDQKHDSHPILADYGTDQFSIRINDKGNDIVVEPLQSFSFKSITPFQTKFKTPTKKNNKTLHQQSLLLNDTDVTSDDEDHIYTRIPKSDSSFLQDTTLQTENYSTRKQPTHTTSQKSISAINVQPNLPSLTHCQQIILFYDTSFFKYKNYFQGFFLPDDYSLDIKTLQQQQSQDPDLTNYSWLLNNEKPEFVTPLITGTPFLHVFTKNFHNFSLTNPQILLVYILQTPLLSTNPLLQFLYKTLFVYAFLSDCLKLSLTKSMNTLILA